MTCSDPTPTTPAPDDERTQQAALQVSRLAAGDVLTQDDRTAIVRLVCALDDLRDGCDQFRRTRQRVEELLDRQDKAFPRPNHSVPVTAVREALDPDGGTTHQ